MLFEHQQGFQTDIFGCDMGAKLERECRTPVNLLFPVLRETPSQSIIPSTKGNRFSKRQENPPTVFE